MTEGSSGWPTEPAFPPKVADDELLWRRLHRDPLVPDGNGGTRPSSAAFKDPAMSVDRVEIVRSLGHGAEYTRQDGAGVAEFSVATARGLGQEVIYKPVPANPAHAQVEAHKSQGTDRALSRQCVFHA